MLKTLAKIFGLDSPPPPPPKRRPTARKAKAPPPAPVAPPPAPRVPAAVPLPTFALALRTFIRQWGQHGPKPSPERLDAAAYALGKDFAAFLTALHLTDGPLTRFLVPEDDITRVAVDAGMREKISLACYGELDVWSAAEKIDLRNRTLARQGGRPVPAPLHIPDEVQIALIKRMNEAAARLAKGGAGGKSGGVKPVPPESMGPAEPVMLDPEGGGRSRVASAAESPDEAASDAEGGRPTPKMSGGGKRRKDDEAEETATGLHMPPPPSPDDDEPEGGGLGLPRF